MRRLFAIGFILLIGTLAGMAQHSRSPIVLKRANSLTVSEENGQKRQELRGNVLMAKDSLDVSCDYAIYYPDSGLGIFENNVVARDLHRVLFADRVTYNEWTDELEASGRVRVYQSDTLSATSRRAIYKEALSQGWLYDDVRMREQNRRVQLDGDRGFIDHIRRYGWVIGNPIMTERDSLMDILTRVHGDTVEYFDDRKLVRVSGNVKIERDSLTATGKTLDYFTQDRTAILVGDPRALRGADDIKGDTMKLFFEEDVLSRVEVEGHALATSPADSGFAEPRNRMEGRHMTLWIDHGKVDRARIEGTAVATYFIREKDDPRGLNVTSGDVLSVFFENSQIARIRVEGGTQGTYTPQRLVKATPADTTNRR